MCAAATGYDEFGSEPTAGNLRGRIRGGDQFREAQVFGGRNFEIQRGSVNDRDGYPNLFDQVGVVGGDDAIGHGAIVRSDE